MGRLLKLHYQGPINLNEGHSIDSPMTSKNGGILENKNFA